CPTPVRSEMYSPAVWGDFMHTDWERRIRLDVPGTERDLKALGIDLREGARIVIYQEDANAKGTTDDLITVATMHFDEEENRWVAIVDWDEVKHVSDLTETEAARYRLLRRPS